MNTLTRVLAIVSVSLCLIVLGGVAVFFFWIYSIRQTCDMCKKTDAVHLTLNLSDANTTRVDGPMSFSIGPIGLRPTNPKDLSFLTWYCKNCHHVMEAKSAPQ